MHIDLFFTSFDVCCFVVGESYIFIIQYTTVNELPMTGLFANEPIDQRLQLHTIS